MKKIQISESEFRKLIREEGEKIKKEIILRAQLEKIEQELSKLNEVHAGEEMSPGPDGVHSGQKKPVFTKKGSHLVEDEMENSDSESEDMDMPETSEEEMSETLSKEDVMDAIRDLGNKLDLNGSLEFSGNEEENDSDEEIEIDLDDSDDSVGDGGDSIDLDVDVEKDSEEMGSEMGSEEGGEEMGSEEDLEEGEEGVDPKTGLPLPPKEMGGIKGGMVGENVDPKKQKLMEERERMRKLAGLIKESK